MRRLIAQANTAGGPDNVTAIVVRILEPCEDLWRQLKASVAANRTDADITELAQRAVAWLEAIPPLNRLRRAGATSSKFQWLPT